MVSNIHPSNLLQLAEQHELHGLMSVQLGVGILRKSVASLLNANIVQPPSSTYLYKKYEIRRNLVRNNKKYIFTLKLDMLTILKTSHNISQDITANRVPSDGLGNCEGVTVRQCHNLNFLCRKIWKVHTKKSSKH